MCLRNIFRRKTERFDGIPEKIVRRWKVCDVVRGTNDKIISVMPLYVKRKRLTINWLKSWHSKDYSLSKIYHGEYIAGFHVFTKKKDAYTYLNFKCDHLTFKHRLEVLKVECAGLLASGNMVRSRLLGDTDETNKIEVYEYIRLIE